MKKHLLVGLFVVALGLGAASAQTQTAQNQTASRSFTARVGQRSERVQRQGAREPLRRGDVGAFPRAARGGNPLQLLNPRAPAKYYGPPQDTVTWNPYFERERYSGNQITGLILFGVAW